MQTGHTLCQICDWVGSQLTVKGTSVNNVFMLGCQNNISSSIFQQI